MKKKLICLITAMTLVLSQGITSFAVENVGELIDSEVEIQEETVLANTDSSENVVNEITDGAEKSQEAVTEGSVEAVSAEEASLAEGDASLTEASTEVLEAVTESSEIISAAEGISGDALNASLASSTALEGKELEEQLKQIYEIETYNSGVAVDEEFEPNENSDTATVIETNKDYSGVLSTDKDIDYYKFTTTETGIISFSFSNEAGKSSSNYWTIKLIGTECGDMYSTNVYGSNLTTVSSPTYGVKAGTYYIKIDGYYYSHPTDVNYTIRANFAATTDWENELNQSADTANEIIPGQEIEGNLYYNKDVDYYKFIAPENGTISFDFRNDSGSSSNYWTVKLIGTECGDMYSTNVYGSNLTTVSSPTYGVKAGTYYIKIDGYYYSHPTNVNYYIKANFTATTDWEFEDNDSTDKATAISTGKNINGNLYNDKDVDYYIFAVNSPGKISLDFSNKYLDSSSYWTVRLIDPSGKNIYEQKVFANNLKTISSDVFDAAAGTYYIKIDGYYYSHPTNVNYTIKVNSTSASAGAESFVTRLYNVGLGRSPEADGLNYWTNSLMSGEKKAVDVVQGVLCSQEYSNKGKSNGEVVNDCYQAMLGRDADASGYADWTSQLDAGMSVNAIFAGFVGSEEFANLCASYGIQPGTFALTEERDKNAGVTKFVSRLYTQALGRAYDVDGLNDWCGKINANPSRENILNISTNGFFHSQEFTNKNLNNTEFVKVLYRTFLGREYDDAGLANWVGQLDRGENTRDGVIGGFANSQEFSNIMAQYGL